MAGSGLRLLASAVVIVASLCGASGALADDGAVGKSGQGVVPLQNNEVEMVAERVDLYPFLGWTFVEAEFTLRNTGPAAAVLVGFPEEQFKYEEQTRGVRPLEIKDFTASVDGRPVAVSLERAEPSPLIQGRQLVGWHTFTVPFAADQTRVVRHTYWLRPHWSSNGAQHLSYLLQTGATWKGNIGRADIYLHPSGGYTLDDLMPGGYGNRDPRVARERLAGGEALAWHLSDFEPGPQDDINVYIEAPGTRLVVLSVGEADGSALRPGDPVRYSVGPIYPSERWQAGTCVVLYAGAEGVRVAEGTLEAPAQPQPGEADTLRFAGEATLPAGVTRAHGRAVEVWAEAEPGGRSLSTMVFLADYPGVLPVSGSAFSAQLLVGLAWVGLSLLAAGLRLRHAASHPFQGGRAQRSEGAAYGAG